MSLPVMVVIYDPDRSGSGNDRTPTCAHVDRERIREPGKVRWPVRLQLHERRHLGWQRHPLPSTRDAARRYGAANQPWRWMLGTGDPQTGNEVCPCQPDGRGSGADLGQSPDRGPAPWGGLAASKSVSRWLRRPALVVDVGHAIEELLAPEARRSCFLRRSATGAPSPR